MSRLLCALLCLAGLLLPARGEQLLAGVAQADVTPAVGTPLAGYGGRIARGVPDLDPRTPRHWFRPSTGVLEADARAAGLPGAWVVGLANGHMGYVCTAEEYREGGYEAWLTLHGPGSAERLRQAFRRLLAAIAPV